MNQKIFIILGGVGVVASLIFAVLLNQFPNMIQKQVRKQLVIKADSDDYDKFVSPDVPIYMKFYLFDINNPEAILEGKKPNLTEKGPYSFLETRVKQVDRFDDQGNAVTYKEVKTFHYDPKTSRKSSNLGDVVTHINLPAMAVMGGSFHISQQGAGFIMRSLFPQIATNTSKTSMFLNHTVGELLFDTYPVEFIDDLRMALVNLSLSDDLIKRLDNLVNFAYFMGKNATDEGQFTIHTGADDIRNLLQIETWKGQPEVDYWVANSTCNDIVGTDATGFAPNVKKDSKLKIFTTDLCRSFPLVFKEKSKVKGISTYRFIIPSWAFDGPAKNPDNQCFCIAQNAKDCQHNGILDISSCRQFAPLVASSPQFFQADDDLYQAIEGLDERRADRCQTYLDIEPTTGKVLSAYKRLQISAWLKNDYSIQKTKANVFLPLLWVEEGFEITDELADEFKSKVTKKVNLGSSLLITGLIISVLFLVAGLGLFFYHKFRPDQEIVDPRAKVMKSWRPDLNPDSSSNPIDKKEANSQTKF